MTPFHPWGTTSVSTCTPSASLSVVEASTLVNDSQSTVLFKADTCHSVSNELRVFIQGDKVMALQDADNSSVAYIKAERKGEVGVNIITGEDIATASFVLPPHVWFKVSAVGTTIRICRDAYKE